MQNPGKKHVVLFFGFILYVVTIVFHSCSTQSPRESPESNSYVGSASCQSCHSGEYREWRGSHHNFSMSKASEESVLGNFNNAEHVINGITSRFYKKENKYYIHTQGTHGEYKEYEILYTFGYHPLQQYLTEMEDGKLQALRVAWDEYSICFLFYRSVK
jgi:hypothetical protein